MTARRKIGLIFHGIGTPGRPLEPGEAPYWISTARFEQVLDRIMALPDPSLIRITFDDGNLSDHDIALPRLRAHGLPAQVFVLSDRIDQPGSLGTAQIRALQAAGIAIGSHGAAHRNWPRLPPAELEDELTRSRRVLEQVCGSPVATAAIPFGSYNGRVLAALRQAGYICAYSSDRGWMDSEAFLRPRTSIREDTTDADLSAILAGRMPLAGRARRALGMARRRLSHR